jgi:hypothetical protein
VSTRYTLEYEIPIISPPESTAMSVIASPAASPVNGPISVIARVSGLIL